MCDLWHGRWLPGPVDTAPLWGGPHWQRCAEGCVHHSPPDSGYCPDDKKRITYCRLRCDGTTVYIKQCIEVSNPCSVRCATHVPGAYLSEWWQWLCLNTCNCVLNSRPFGYAKLERLIACEISHLRMLKCQDILILAFRPVELRKIIVFPDPRVFDSKQLLII